MTATALKQTGERSLLVKRDPNAPALYVPEQGGVIAIAAGTSFAGISFAEDTLVTAGEPLLAGTDYVVRLADGKPVIERLGDHLSITLALGGFHYAPGGNATARQGGDEKPVINPCSIWDHNFRPSAFPKGMTLVTTASGKRFWVDIYLLGADHLKNGTSAIGVTIADHYDEPDNPAGGKFDNLNWHTAKAIMAHHGKQLLSREEFEAAAHGVTERSATPRDPKITKLDAPRTSRRGVIQATGNMYVWGHDGDPDEPAAVRLGGSWDNAANSCSRASYWSLYPGYSDVHVGARGRCDHLRLDRPAQ